MKFLDLRKYFFTNVIALWFYFFFYFNFQIIKPILLYHHPLISDVIIGWSSVVILFLIIFAYIFILTILEFLIRKFIIERRFPKFKLKLKIKIKIPKVITYIYNVIFSIGFISAIIFSILGLVVLTI